MPPCCVVCPGCCCWPCAFSAGSPQNATPTTATTRIARQPSARQRMSKFSISTNFDRYAPTASTRRRGWERRIDLLTHSRCADTAANARRRHSIDLNWASWAKQGIDRKLAIAAARGPRRCAPPWHGAFIVSRYTPMTKGFRLARVALFARPGLPASWSGASRLTLEGATLANAMRCDRCRGPWPCRPQDGSCPPQAALPLGTASRP